MHAGEEQRKAGEHDRGRHPMIRVAPSCFAASTAMRPTAPQPTTTVLPGPASAATAANQPVPRTSEAASRLAILSTGGVPGWRRGCRQPVVLGGVLPAHRQSQRTLYG